VGTYGFNLVTAFTNANWVESFCPFAAFALCSSTLGKSNSSITNGNITVANNAVDPAAVSFIGFGDT
jgi:hypothetical protein